MSALNPAKTKFSSSAAFIALVFFVCDLFPEDGHKQHSASHDLNYMSTRSFLREIMWIATWQVHLSLESDVVRLHRLCWYHCGVTLTTVKVWVAAEEHLKSSSLEKNRTTSQEYLPVP